MRFEQRTWQYGHSKFVPVRKVSGNGGILISFSLSSGFKLVEVENELIEAVSLKLTLLSSSLVAVEGKEWALFTEP